MNSDFALKLNRAHQHLKDLDAQTTQWLNAKHYALRRDRDPERPEYCRFLLAVEPIPKDPFALLIGDILHNLRASLDYLAFMLMTKHTKRVTRPLAKTSEFPIFGDEGGKGISSVENDRRKDFSKMIGGVAPEAQALIRGMQPYHSGKEYIRHPLWHLRELSNIDKHRMILIAAWHNIGGFIHNERGVDIKVASGQFIEGETPVVWANVSPGEQEMHVQYTPALNLVFGQLGSPADGKAVCVVLKDIHNFILYNVVQPLSQYLSLAIFTAFSTVMG